MNWLWICMSEQNIVLALLILDTNLLEIQTLLGNNSVTMNEKKTVVIYKDKNLLP